MHRTIIKAFPVFLAAFCGSAGLSASALADQAMPTPVQQLPAAGKGTAEQLERQFGTPARDALELLMNPDPAIEAEYRVWATADNWRWTFRFELPEGFDQNLPESTPPPDGLPPRSDIVLPRGATASISITSADLIYPFTVPDLKISRDAIPGRIDTVIVDTSKASTFSSRCDAGCGEHASRLAFKIHIVEPTLFTQWILRSESENGDTK